MNKRIYPLISQTNIAYPDRAPGVTGKIAKGKSGDHISYFIVDDGRSIYAHIGAPAFKLVFFSRAEPTGIGKSIDDCNSFLNGLIK
ncbi:MAG: hypothetical protein ABIR81_07500 [Ginsengibacter sp.]